MCVVSAEVFYKNPQEYLERADKETVTIITDTGSYYLLPSGESAEELDAKAGIARGEADIAAGRVLTSEEFWASVDEKLEELKSRASL